MSLEKAVLLVSTPPDLFVPEMNKFLKYNLRSNYTYNQAVFLLGISVVVNSALRYHPSFSSHIMVWTQI